jgi:hypothetical protein
MAHLIPVRYKGRGELNYPPDVKPLVGEISLNFSVGKSGIAKSITELREKGVEFFSLHTQEPHSRDEKIRKQILNNLHSIVTENNLVNIKRSPTYLWSSKEWIEEFITFLKIASESFDDRNSVRVIELHTPKNKSYINSIDTFMDKLKSFYDAVSSIFPKAEFVIENSYEEPYLYNIEQINEFSNRIDELKGSNYKFGIVLDIPQLLQAEGLRDINADGDKIENLFRSLEKSKHNIRSIHVWGTRGEGENGNPHHGDLNTLFHHGYPRSNKEIEKAESLKQSLLKGLSFILSDENKRYLVPELNGDPYNDLESILRDLSTAGINFDYSLP